MAQDASLQLSAGLPPAGGGSIAFSSHTARIEVRVDAPGLLDQVRELLPPGAVETDSSRIDVSYRLERDGQRNGASAYAVYLNGQSVIRRARLDTALGVLSNSFHWGVAAHSRTLLFVHAGVVVWQGRALMFPGASRYGKSTLVDALVRLGATYYTDECAALDEHGHVHPYRKPIRLRRDHPRHSGPAFALRRQPVTSGEALPVGLILFTRYRAGADWAPVPISCGQALLGLTGSTVLAGVEPHRTLSVLSKVVGGAPAYASERPEAEATADRIVTLLDNVPVSSAARRSHSVTSNDLSQETV